MKPWRILLVEPDGSRCTSWMNEFAKPPGIGTVRCLESLQDLQALDADGDLPFEAALLGGAVASEDVLSSIRWLRRAGPACRIIVFAVPEESSHAIEFFEAGAWAVLSDRVSARELRQCLASAARGEAILSPVMAGKVLRRIRDLSLVRVHALPSADALQALTRREREILTLIARRLSNQEIARELVVEVGTVKNHVHSVLKKLGVASRYEAAAFGMETAALAEREAA